MTPARRWLAIAVGAVFAALFGAIGNVYVGAASGVMALAMMAFILDDRHT